MHDAVLFMVMVSLSGVVLLPALQSDTSVHTSIQKHREELADETLLMLMTSRCDEFGYTLAGEQIEDLTGLDIDYKSSSNNDIIESLIKTFLGREQKHKTYSDLCVENLVCQLSAFDNRINIFTSDFDSNLKLELNQVLEKYLGEKYRYNLVVRWRPILGIEFGGKIEIGINPPETTHVAKSYATLPDNYFTEWFDTIDDFIEDSVNDVKKFSSDEESLKTQIKNLTMDIIEKIVLDGFGSESGIIDNTIDYVFSSLEGGISSIFGDSSDMLLSPLEEIYPGITSGLIDKLIETVSTASGVKVKDSNKDGKIDCTDAISGLKNFVKDNVKSLVDDVFDGHLESFAEYIVSTLDNTSINEELTRYLNDFIKEYINPLRADFVITIWGLRE